MKWRRWSAKITLHSWRELWEPPWSIWLWGRNIPRCTSFVLHCLFDVQVTGGVSCDRFDVELLDFIVTSMPTRRAVTHFLHLNNHVSLRHPLYEHQSLNTCFHIPADYHTIFVGGGLCSNRTTAPTLSVNTLRHHQMAGNQPSSTRSPSAEHISSKWKHSENAQAILTVKMSSLANISPKRPLKSQRNFQAT